MSPLLELGHRRDHSSYSGQQHAKSESPCTALLRLHPLRRRNLNSFFLRRYLAQHQQRRSTACSLPSAAFQSLMRAQHIMLTPAGCPHLDQATNIPRHNQLQLLEQGSLGWIQVRLDLPVLREGPICQRQWLLLTCHTVFVVKAGPAAAFAGT